MRTTLRLLYALLLLAGFAQAQDAPRPYIGYLCGAGGQRGTVFRITAGGQNLRGANRVIVSGNGVQAKVIRHQRTPWLLNTDNRRVVAQRLRQLAAQKMNANPRAERREPKKKKKPKKGKKQEQAEPAVMPDHPMLMDLESLTPKELRRVAYEFLDPARRSQLSAQIAEVVEIEVRIDSDAAPGEREFRIGTPRGLTNPVVFHVGTLPEFSEHEPNDYRTSRQPDFEVPCVLDGRVSFKDLDRFRFRARRGQKLVIDTQARRLVPYVADAVPGWFQATLTLYDSEGKEVSFVDDYRFDPDPVVFFEVPADGEYVLEIRDAIYRGRDDFVYRITIAEGPFITSIFPLGGQVGSPTVARVAGWNLPWKEVLLDTWTGFDRTQCSAWGSGDSWSNSITYAVDDLPDLIETPGQAQRLSLPQIVNGHIEVAGEVDVYRFEGRAGDEIVAEVEARRLGSPLDSLLRLTDGAGKVIAWNDDQEDKTAGLVTHQADSYVRYKLPADGTYQLRMADAQGHGGAAYAYRLRVSAPRPDFAVMITPASLNAPGGTVVPFTVHAVRRDGFEGEIELTLNDAPNGFLLSGATIPAGLDRIRMTLAVPPRRPGAPVPLRIVGRAHIDGKTVRRMAIPAEDMMQAFGLRHLVAARELLVDVLRSGRKTPPLRLAQDEPTTVPIGGTAEVRILSAGLPPLNRIEFKLKDPPAGVTLRSVRPGRGGAVVVIAAEAGKAEAGVADNLIVEAYALVVPDEKKSKEKSKGRKKAQTRRYFIGVLPAIPVEIVEVSRLQRN